MEFQIVRAYFSIYNATKKLEIQEAKTVFQIWYSGFLVIKQIIGNVRGLKLNKEISNRYNSS